MTESWPGRFVSSCLRRYFHHDVGRQSAALAYYLLFTLFPFLIFLSSLLGLLQLEEYQEAEERVIEYTLDEEGNRRAVREKTQIKYYPPDVAAAKACLELESQDDFSDYTDEELLKEKDEK